jgi:hypothetical protein
MGEARSTHGRDQKYVQNVDCENLEVYTITCMSDYRRGFDW